MKKLSFIICALASLVSYADPVAVPNTFSAGTPAKASEVNANFTALANAVNSLSNPWMVYDSTGKLVGSLIVGDFGSPTNGIKGYTILMSNGGIKFFAKFSEGIRPECMYCNNNNFVRYINWIQLSSSNNGYGVSIYSYPSMDTSYYESADCTGTEFIRSSDQLTTNAAPFNQSLVFYNNSYDGSATTDYMSSYNGLAYMKIYSGTPQALQPASYKDKYQVCSSYTDTAMSIFAYKVVATLPASEFNFVPPLSIR